MLETEYEGDTSTRSHSLLSDGTLQSTYIIHIDSIENQKSIYTAWVLSAAHANRKPNEEANISLRGYNRTRCRQNVNYSTLMYTLRSSQLTSVGCYVSLQVWLSLEPGAALTSSTASSCRSCPSLLSRSTSSYSVRRTRRNSLSSPTETWLTWTQSLASFSPW